MAPQTFHQPPTALTFADEGLLLLEHVSPSNPTPPPPGWPLHYLLPLPGRFSSHIFARFSTTASRVLLKYHLLRDAFSSVQLLSPVLCHPMDCSTPCFPVHHQLPELTQIHVHRVSDAIQPFHPLSSPSPPAFNLSQHQSLHEAKVLEFQLQFSPSNQ